MSEHKKKIQIRLSQVQTHELSNLDMNAIGKLVANMVYSGMKVVIPIQSTPNEGECTHGTHERTKA